MQARLLQMEAEKNAVCRVLSCVEDHTKLIQITETATPGSSTPKPETNGQQDGEGDQAMDEDEPGAVDARSIYIGNVRANTTPSETWTYDRSTTALLQKRFRAISKLAER